MGFQLHTHQPDPGGFHDPVWGPMVPDTCLQYWTGLASLGITRVTIRGATITVADKIKALGG